MIHAHFSDIYTATDEANAKSSTFIIKKQSLNNNAKDSILLPDSSHLNCPLYSDDLLLISTSAEGLQQSLDTFSKYCQDWLLKINPTKTKVIVFQKKSRKSAID